MLGGGIDIESLPDTQKLYYKATAKVSPKSGSLGSAIMINNWDSTTGEGIIVCASDIIKIEDSAFSECSSLTSITIPNSVKSIGYSPFNGCGFTSVTIPDSVTEIGYAAFYACRSLTNVTIGNSVTTIGGWAFRDCYSLTSVYCKAITPPALEDMFVFEGIYSGLKIYVPTESVDAYKSAKNWRGKAYLIEGYEF